MQCEKHVGNIYHVFICIKNSVTQALLRYRLLEEALGPPIAYILNIGMLLTRTRGVMLVQSNRQVK